MFLIFSIAIVLQALTVGVEASCDNEMCKSPEYDCSQSLPGCTSKDPVALCENNGVYYCVLKKPKVAGPSCPICDSAAFDCTVEFSIGKCDPKLTKAVCPDSNDPSIYYCVQVKVDQPGTTTLPPSTTLLATLLLSTKLPTTLAPSTMPPTTLAPSTMPPTTLAPSTKPPTTLAPSTKPPTTLAPSTMPPTTLAPSTESPTTQPPSTESPTTQPPSTESPTTQPPSNKPETTTIPEPTTTVKTTPSPIPGNPGHPCGIQFPEITPSGPTVCIPGSGAAACPAPIFMHAPLFTCVPGSECCVMEPATTTLPTTTVITTTPEPTTTTLPTTTTPSPTPGKPGQICGNKYPEITPSGLNLCLPGTDERACPAPVFTYSPLFDCVSGYQCCTLMN